MSSYKKYRNSRFVTKGDLDSDEMLLTITGVSEEDVSLPGQAKEMKPALTAEELEKPLILNWVNLERLERITGSEDMEDWPGHQVVLYFDPEVSYGGKTVGGLRLKAPRKGASAKAVKRPVQKPQSVAVPDDEDRSDYGPPVDWET